MNTKQKRLKRNKRLKHKAICQGFAGIILARVALAGYVTNRKTNGKGY